MSRRGTLRIGTSGWIYKHWANGVFYPPRLAQRQWLPYFMEHFDTVEVNATFYRLPTEAMAKRWAELATPGFRYAIKLWRMITHMKKLKDCAEQLERFFAAVDHLGERRGPLLVQLPPMLGLDLARLEAFLDELAEATAAQPWAVAVEFRREDWLAPEVTRALDRRGAALVLQDMHYLKIEQPNAAPFVYIRRHGSTGSYSGDYAPAEIEADARRIEGWLGEGRDVWVYYNNDVGGAAIRNARQLIERLQEPTG